MLDWESLFKRYVWDTRTTPYFTQASKLTRAQANHEVLAFSLFIGILFSVVALAALTDHALFGRSPLVGLYAFSVVAGAVILNYTKALFAAIYVAAAPLACLAFILIYGFSDERSRPDTFIVLCIVAVILIYAPRLIAVARSYPNMPEGDAPPARRTLFK